MTVSKKTLKQLNNLHKAIDDKQDEINEIAELHDEATFLLRELERLGIFENNGWDSAWYDQLEKRRYKAKVSAMDFDAWNRSMANMMEELIEFLDG